MTRTKTSRTPHAALLAGLLAAGAAITAAVAGAEPEPVLGSAMFEDCVTGYGSARPDQLSQCGNCGGDVITNITWDSWGGPLASGNGVECQSAGDAMRGEQPTQVSLTASNLGSCNGTLAYRTLQIGSRAPQNVCMNPVSR